MAHSLHVHFLPGTCNSGDLAGATAVVIDILRASTTIATALQNGAVAVHPAAAVDDARQLASSLESESPLLGGERGGIRIKGFDLGNSPAEYPSSRVAGRRIVFTTTNGTRALLSAAAADSVVVGSFVNLNAVRNHLVRRATPVHLVCAGTDGAVTGEDVLFAGCLVWHLTRSTSTASPETAPFELTDAARIALSHWEMQVMLNLEAPDGSADSDQMLRAAIVRQIIRVLQTCRGGRNLLELGYDDDITRCSQLDTVDGLPTYDAARNAISF